MSDGDRRRFLAGLVGVGAGVVIGGCGGAQAQAQAGAGKGNRAGFATGRGAAEFEVGSATLFFDARVFVCRDAGGLFAVSAVCTHKGCIVGDDLPDGFTCQCHGSRFRPDGSVVQGPAAAPLACYALCLDRDGRVVVDPARQVAPSVRA